VFYIGETVIGCQDCFHRVPIESRSGSVRCWIHSDDRPIALPKEKKRSQNDQNLGIFRLGLVHSLPVSHKKYPDAASLHLSTKKTPKFPYPAKSGRMTIHDSAKQVPCPSI